MADTDQFDAVDLDMIRRGDMLGSQLGARVYTALAEKDARIAELEAAVVVQRESKEYAQRCCIAAESALTASRAECEGLRAASARDVLAERRRQIEAEGWHENHDNDHVGGELAKAAACYAIWDTIGGDEGIYIHGRWKTIVDLFWPWDRDWWKPSNPRRNLIKAGALILAEIDRLDRAALSQKESGDADR